MQYIDASVWDALPKEHQDKACEPVQLAINAAVENHQRFIADVQKKNYERVQNESAEKAKEIEMLLTENEKLRFEVAEIRRVIGDRYPDALMWGALHDYKQQLAELCEIAEGLALAVEQRVITTGPCMFRYSQEHQATLTRYNQFKEKNEK